MAGIIAAALGIIALAWFLLRLFPALFPAVLVLVLPLLPFIFALSFFTELWRQFGPKASTAPAEQ